MEIQLDKEQSRKVEFKQNKVLLLDGKEHAYDLLRLSDEVYHLILNERSYQVTVQELDRTVKKATLEINGTRFEVQGKDRFDALLEAMGMNMSTSSKVKALKDPMPGLVLEVCVSDGQSVTVGTPLIILEAMKMENILKAPQDGVVRLSSIMKGQAVEKGDVLLKFED
jgi:biotin carboxyl carrier protein